MVLLPLLEYENLLQLFHFHRFDCRKSSRVDFICHFRPIDLLSSFLSLPHHHKASIAVPDPLHRHKPDAHFHVIHRFSS